MAPTYIEITKREREKKNTVLLFFNQKRKKIQHQHFTITKHINTQSLEKKGEGETASITGEKIVWWNYKGRIVRATI